MKKIIIISLLFWAVFILAAKNSNSYCYNNAEKYILSFSNIEVDKIEFYDDNEIRVETNDELSSKLVNNELIIKANEKAEIDLYLPIDKKYQLKTEDYFCEFDNTKLFWKIGKKMELTKTSDEFHVIDYENSSEMYVSENYIKISENDEVVEFFNDEIKKNKDGEIKIEEYGFWTKILKNLAKPIIKTAIKKWILNQ